MPRLNTICVICEEKFKSSDIIRSTYCGHIFHKCCLDDWKSMRLSCPMCQREFSSETFEHQLFLELDDEEENFQKSDINILKTEVQSANETDDIQVQMKEMQLNFQRFQEEFIASEQTKQKLERQIKDLQKSLQNLSIETKEKTKELDMEILQLKNFSPASDDNIVFSDSTLKSQIRILDNKLNHLSGELEKQKMKLEGYITTTTTKQHDCSSPLIPSNCVKTSESLCTNISSSETDNFVVIEDFPVAHKTYPLENKIIELGTMMHMAISPKDICKVRQLDRFEYKTKTSDKIALLVEFRSNDMKMKFLAKKNILKNYLTTSYVLRPIEDDIYSVYLYANEKLKNNAGFTDVSFEYDTIVVKYKDGQEFELRKKMDVDSLLKRHIQEMDIKAAIAEKKFTKAWF